MIQQIARILSRWVYAASVLSILAVSAFVGESHAQTGEQRWGFGSDLGLTAGTVNGTVFTLGFNADYYIDRNFSIGPMSRSVRWAIFFRSPSLELAATTCA